MSEIKPHEWATFHIKIKLDAADYDYYDGSYHGHGDRLVLEYYEKPQDTLPVERLYFEFGYTYWGECDPKEAIAELLESLTFDLDAAEEARC